MLLPIFGSLLRCIKRVHHSTTENRKNKQKMNPQQQTSVKTTNPFNENLKYRRQTRNINALIKRSGHWPKKIQKTTIYKLLISSCYCSCTQVVVLDKIFTTRKTNQNRTHLYIFHDPKNVGWLFFGGRTRSTKNNFKPEEVIGS